MEQSRRDEIKYREGAKTQEWKQPGMDWNQNTRWPCVYLSQMRKRLLASVTLHWSLVTPSLCSSFSQSRGLRKLGARESAALGGGCGSHLQVSYKGPHPHLHSVPLLNAIL